MQKIPFYQRIINDRISTLNLPEHPANLYNPIEYLLNLGGKRIRPVLTLLSAELFDGTVEKALPTAMAVEIFHNFSLMHDDIMDKAPLRRGKVTVHEKWSESTAILSGDLMLIQSYQYLAKNDAALLPDLLNIFNAIAADVCIGQQLDMDFETLTDVTIEDYINMIRLKTAVLIGGALQLGAIIGKAEKKNADLIYDFGENLGIAFQLQDDFLDAFGDPGTFGKQVGGDILENKKTYLLLKALELADAEEEVNIHNWLTKESFNGPEKIAGMMDIYKRLNVEFFIKQEMEKFTDKAYSALDLLEVDEEKKAPLKELAESLLIRVQ